MDAKVAMRLMGQTFVGITRVHVQMILSVLATSFAGSVAKTSLKAPTAAENPIPAMKTIQALRPVALTCTNVTLTKETVKMTVIVREFSNVAIAIVENIFRMGQIVVSNQVPRKESLDLSATAPTFLTYLSVALKNTNADFTKVTVRLTLSAKAISNAAIRIAN